MASEGGCSPTPLPRHRSAPRRGHLIPYHSHRDRKPSGTLRDHPGRPREMELLLEWSEGEFLRLSPCNTACQYACVLIMRCYLRSINLLCGFIYSNAAMKYCHIQRNKLSHLLHLVLTSPLWIDSLPLPPEKHPRTLLQSKNIFSECLFLIL